MKIGLARNLLCCTLISLAVVSPAIAADWQDGASAQWKATLEAAKKEGPLAIAAGVEYIRPHAEAFERDTGLKVAPVTGAVHELLARVVREARAKSSTIDIFFGSGGNIYAAREGLLAPIAPMLMLPGVVEGKNWTGGQLYYHDSDRTWLPGPIEYVQSYIVVNTDIVKPGAIESWQDLLKPEWKGKIIAYDPTVPGPGQSYTSYLTKQFGIDFVKSLYVGQDIKLSRVMRQLVESVARGNTPVSFYIDPATLENFRAEGFKNLQALHLQGAPPATLGGESVLMSPKDMPHPNAAKVFVNWFLSKPGQETFVAVKRTASRRVDVSRDMVPDYLIPKPGVASFDLYAEGYYVDERPKFVEQINGVLGR